METISRVAIYFDRVKCLENELFVPLHVVSAKHESKLPCMLSK